MKKLISLFLTIVIVLGMLGCGGNAEEPEPVAESVSATSSVTEEVDGGQANEVGEMISLNQIVSYKEIEFTLDEAAIVDHVGLPYGAKEDTNIIYLFKPVKSEDGNVLLALSGEIKNTGSKEIFTFGNIFANFIFDDTVTYVGKAINAQTSTGGAATNKGIQPQVQAAFYITAEIPVELAETFTECTIIIGFHRDGFDKIRLGTTIDDADDFYRLTVSKSCGADNPILINNVEPTQYFLGEPISVDTLDLCFEEIELLTDMHMTYKGKMYSYSTSDAADGTHNLCLVGTIVNKSTKPLTWTEFIGSVVVNG